MAKLQLLSSCIHLSLIKNWPDRVPRSRIKTPGGLCNKMLVRLLPYPGLHALQRVVMHGFLSFGCLVVDKNPVGLYWLSGSSLLCEPAAIAHLNRNDRRRRLSSIIIATKSAVVHRVCSITMLITNEMQRDVALHLPSFLNAWVCCWWWRRQQEVALLAIVEIGRAPPIVLGYDMLCASDSIHSPPYIQG